MFDSFFAAMLHSIQRLGSTQDADPVALPNFLRPPPRFEQVQRQETMSEF